MLLEFKMKNFKSFRNLVEFKMTPAQKIKDLEYSLLKEKANNKEEKALSSSVIYGPNSSGKTNLIGGLQVFKAIVLRGNIKDADDLTSINIATEKLDFIPHIDSKENEPTYFYIKFLTNNMIIEYSITFLTEKLLSKEKDKRKILEEKLKIDGNNIYIRNEKIQIEEGSNFEDPFVTATDNYDGDVTSKVVTEGTVDTNTPGNYTITYRVTDSSNNESTVTRTVEVTKKKVVYKPGIAVLNYHFFYSNGENCGQGICLNTSKFEEQLKYLKENNYKTLTMQEFVDWIYGRIELPQKSVLLTIDEDRKSVV